MKVVINLKLNYTEETGVAMKAKPPHPTETQENAKCQTTDKMNENKAWDINQGNTLKFCFHVRSPS